MQILQRGIIDLISACLTEKKADIKLEFDWTTACQIGRSHGIVPMLYYGIGHSDVQIPEDIRDKLRLETVRSAMLDQYQLNEVAQIEREFQAQGIDYLPLKGMVMKHRYPHTEVRMMGDADIMIREQQYGLIKPIMKALGFTEVQESDHELIWNKPGMMTVELHKRLIPSYNKDYYAYFGDGWKLAQKTETSRYAMRSEDEFIYLFTHYAKHYRDGGIGIRQVVDLYIYKQTSPELDIQYVEAELRKLRLYAFYRNTMETIAAWFENGTDSAMTDYLTNWIFSSGAFGTSRNQVLASGARAAANVDTGQAKRKRLMELLFPSAEKVMYTYPILKKCKIVLPFVWCHRGIKVLIQKRSTIKERLNDLDYLTEENVTSYKTALNYVGLDFNFSSKK